jgi:hypothetical protein
VRASARDGFAARSDDGRNGRRGCGLGWWWRWVMWDLSEEGRRRGSGGEGRIAARVARRLA